MRNKWVLLVTVSMILLSVLTFSCFSPPSYVGKWNNSEYGVDLEFTEDGHIVYTVLGIVDLGTYEPYGEEYVKISLEGEAGSFLRYAEADIWKLQISGDSMVVEQGQVLTLTFNRVR